MKALTLLHGIAVAAALTAVSLPLRWLCLFLLPPGVSGLAFWGILTGSYIAILLARAGRRPGRLAVGAGCGLLLAFGAALLPMELAAFVFGATLLIWATRTIYFHPTLTGAAKDLVISLLAFGLLGWTFQISTSVLTGVWVYFLAQAAIALVSVPGERSETKVKQEPDRFAEARRSAEEALGQIM
jgi:hypothetical protein